MGASSSVGKRCVMCGTDCAGRPRVKDVAGHYYCKSCHEAALAGRGGQGDGAAPGTPGAMAMLADLADQVEPPPVLSPCPGCGRGLESGAVLCANCGYDLRLGKAHAVRAVAAPVASGRSSSLLWPIDALVRPGRYYRAVLESATVPAIALMAWIYGMSAVLNRIDAMQLKSSLGDQRVKLLPDNWSTHWIAMLLVGVVSGAILAVVGGWWYGVRLRWAGARNVESGQARCMYLASGMIVAIPHLLCELALTARHSLPSEAFDAELTAVDILPPIFSVWAVVSSYLGVRAVFKPSNAWGALWFLILPLLLYGLATAAVFAVAVVASSGGLLATVAGADVAHPVLYTCDNFTFQHARDWSIDRDDPDFDPHADVHVGSALSGSAHIVMVNYHRSAIEDELERDLRRLRRLLVGATDQGELTQWGSLSGVGRVLTGTNAGEAFEVRAFVARLEHGWILHVAESCAVSQQAAVEPGFELIRRTFRSTAAAPAPLRRPGPG